MSADSSVAPNASAGTSTTTVSSNFSRAAMAIFAAMVFLIVALTGILVETTWDDPNGAVEVLPPDPGSFARR